MLVIKCKQCECIFNIESKKKIEKAKVIEYCNCPSCNEEYREGENNE